MSANVFLLNESGKKPEKVKRSFAKKLVLRLLAIKLGKHLYQRVIVCTVGKGGASQAVAVRPYIPVKLPSHSIPGTLTIGPVTERHPMKQKLLVAARSPELWSAIERGQVEL